MNNVIRITPEEKKQMNEVRARLSAILRELDTAESLLPKKAYEVHGMLHMVRVSVTDIHSIVGRILMELVKPNE